MHGHGESDRPIVPTKPAITDFWQLLKAWKQVEGRGLAKENGEAEVLPLAGPAKQVDRTQSRVSAGRKTCREDLQSELDRVRQAACRDRKLKFTSLWHHVYNIERLREAYLALKRDAAAGLDGQTWRAFGTDLEKNLKGLSDRLAGGRYRAKPVKRVFIPKADGRQRPIGVPVLEDKIVQRATVQVLNAVYETDFLGFSYGFRPGRSAHMALDALAVAIETKKVNYVLDADIRGFFDTLDHGWLMKFVEHRIADRRVLRHIRKWLNAGVLQEGRHVKQEEGTPQGGSISPLLANIYLHYVLDLWAERLRRTRARGDVVIVRYADDFVVGFQHQSDAERFQAELTERFRRFNLELHAEKTRILEFGRWARERRETRGRGKPETFDFLGFTHACDTTRKGKFTVLRRTMAKRMRAKLKALKDALRRRMHDPISETGRWLTRVLVGHYRYYGVPRNFKALDRFRKGVRRLWRYALNRRSQRGFVTQVRMTQHSQRWLPVPRIFHPYPDVRLAVIIQGKSPVR
jgi:group II intron reverse transcriptase/maturase